MSAWITFSGISGISTVFDKTGCGSSGSSLSDFLGLHFDLLSNGLKALTPTFAQVGLLLKS